MPGKSTSDSFDVAVIGGGIIGCATAWRLAQAHQRVTVIEQGEFGQEASSAAAGMLAPQGEKIEPENFSVLCHASRDFYPDFVAEVESLTGRKVGYRQDGSLLVGIEDAECRELEETYEHQTRRGLKLERLTGEEVRRRVAGLAPEIRMGLFVPGDHWLDNTQLSQALAEACRLAGVAMRPASEVARLNVRGEKVDSAGVRSAGREETVSAGQFVLAAGSWSKALAEPLGVHLPIEPCKGQIIEFHAPGKLPHVVRAGHHYLVPRDGGAVLAGTTAEWVGFEKSVTAGGLASILQGTTRIAPVIKDFRFCRAWAGFRPDTPDHLPVLGRGKFTNLVFATGHFRNGILLAPITAQLMVELLTTGSTSHPLEIYRPSRFTD